MAIFTRTNNQSLRAALAERGTKLREDQQDAAQAAEEHLRASAAARVASDTAAAHALAVEQAVTILDEAGVTL